MRLADLKVTDGGLHYFDLTGRQLKTSTSSRPLFSRDGVLRFPNRFSQRTLGINKGVYCRHRRLEITLAKLHGRWILPNRANMVVGFDNHITCLAQISTHLARPCSRAGMWVIPSALAIETR